MRIGSPCSSYAMYTPAAVRDVRQFVFLNLLPTGKPGSGRALSPCATTPSLSLDHHPVCHPYTFTRATLCCSSSTKFSSNGCSQSGNGSPLTGFALDISTSATLSGTSLTRNSGTTFRSWVSIGLTGVVNAIFVGENADQCFDHCSFAGVPPPGPRRTHRFPVGTIFLIGSFVLDVRRVFSTAILMKNKLVPVLHHLAY